MVNRVSGPFVNGQHHVFGPVCGQPGPAGVSLKARSQRVQRTGIERQIQDRRGWFACLVVPGHAIASHRSGSARSVTRADVHLKIAIELPQAARSTPTLYQRCGPVNRSRPPSIAATVLSTPNAGATGFERGEQVWPSG